MIRLFISVEPPETVKQQLQAMCFGMPGARWMEEDQLHFTLRFIGEVDGNVFRDIQDELASVRAPGFSLTLKSVGHFPPRGEPRVLWVGIEKSEPLLVLRSRIERALARADVEPEQRKFFPHVTLARLKDTPASRVGRFLVEHGLFRSERFAVTEFCLYSSRLGAKRAAHRIEAAYPLEDGRPEDGERQARAHGTAAPGTVRSGDQGDPSAS